MVAEYHFIPAAHGAAEPAGHPGFHEGRDAFVKPARGIMPGAGQRAVENRNRVFVGWHHLAEEQRPEAAVYGIRVVAHHDVDGFVIHDPRHALVGGQRFVGVAEGRDADVDEIGRNGSCGAVAVVAKIFEQNGQFLRRGVVKQIVLEIERVFIGPDEMSDQVLVRRAVVQNFDVRGGLDEDFGVGAERGRAEQAAKQKESRDRARD